ncbi:MAG: hypothetical protein VX941_10650 [Pseudomonadota bacterium]|nr:hypothetical protein [Pseudomonadota bacterium]
MRIFLTFCAMVFISMVGGCQSATDAPALFSSKDPPSDTKSIVAQPQLQKNRDGAPIPLTKTNKEREQLAMNAPVAKNIEASLISGQSNFSSDFRLFEPCDDIALKNNQGHFSLPSASSVGDKTASPGKQFSAIPPEEAAEKHEVEIYSPILSKLIRQYLEGPVETQSLSDLKAAEIATSAGLMSFEQLRDLYLEFSFEPAEIEAPLSDALEENSPRRRALLYRAVAAQEVPTAIAEVIKVAFKLARPVGLYEMTLGVYAPFINKLNASFALRWIGYEVSQAQFYLGQPCKAKNWRRYLENITANDPDARQVMRRFWLWEVLSGVTHIGSIETDEIRKWFQAARADEFRERKIQLTYAMLDALNIRLQVQDWGKVLDEVRSDGITDNIKKIEEVAQENQREETVKIVADILGPRRLIQIPPVEVAAIIASLIKIGFADYARKFAVEVAVANQL